jgi:hypothetical protein
MISKKEPKKELFTNSYDIKTKTLNWCDKMKNVGLLTPNQFNQCVSTFKESTGLLQTVSENTNTNTIMLTNNNGLTLACKPDNSIYLVSNVNDNNINQKELYFTLIPQTDNIYAILSPFGKYLISNADYSVTFTGTSIGPLASWTIIKMF